MRNSKRQFLIRGGHLALILICYVFAFLLRFDFALPRTHLPLLRLGLLTLVPAKVLAFHILRLHHGAWRFVGVADLFRILVANGVASCLFFTANALVAGMAFPRSVYLIDLALCILATAGTRLMVRLYKEAVLGEWPRSAPKRILIYGAGAAGLTLLREIRCNRALGYEVVGFLDDDARNQGAVLAGVPVLGAGREAAAIVDRRRARGSRIDEIVTAMPSATGRQRREALANCRAAGVPCKTIPGLGELLKGKVLSAQIRNPSVTDLLGREPVVLDEERIRAKIGGRAVMITGGAGSIGSELCRQVARFEPRALVILDQAESELFQIDLELRGSFPRLNVVAAIGDIRDTGRVREVMQSHAIDSVLHAAAYKHVPLMEAHLLEAIRNNVMGTWNVVRTAHALGVKDFLMISSDKAVNPTSVMGATKRAAELIVSATLSSRTKGVSVRFGNVLASNGSVVPLFQRQIAQGGPVTVTHPDMRRYFMTIPEAVQLVLQASTMGNGSDIFVLDMGEPLRILDLAHNMIRLAGLVPDEDIEVRIIGLRPGEKLFEEINTQAEDMLPTYHDKIKIFRTVRPEWETLRAWLLEMEALLDARDETGAIAHLRRLVPEYRTNGGGRPQVERRLRAAQVSC